ncbi:LysR family transcriptional regulator [Acidaminococcus fermentans]|uniref:LysR family transcriptional regulator n=1 Tax=Acidaminococcus fermentans TaxID=905 RepID=UPI002E779478|nr:LysR family transcriptional regulator [Acidaminococcus fermentans]MEE1598327.1 LysR family transcriptional regulator [Acidaminococcus fermentans]MEE4122588.1 LysR family transcriptional regulator [Acidaminococcus fermentans]
MPNIGSFTKAADALGYTQPAMSQMITSLERELSIKLLYRSRYGVHLTIEGERLFPSVQKMISQYLAMQEIAKEIRGLDTGVIRIGTISSISCHWLPNLIKEFQEQYPNVEFVLHQGDYTSIPEWVRIGEADFGFVNPNAVPNIKTKFVKEGEHRAVLPLNHPLAHNSYVTLEELSKEPFLLLEEGSLSEPLAAFQANGLEPHIRLRVHDDYSILSMIEAGLGVSILPELVLRKTNYQVAILPIKPMVIRKIGLIAKEKNALPLASKYFIDFLFEHINDLP